MKYSRMDIKTKNNHNPLISGISKITGPVLFTSNSPNVCWKIQQLHCVNGDI